jgi:ribonucleoside-triphosphate reductase
MTRIIGYLKRVSNFSEPRQKEASRRFYYEATPQELVEV